MLKTLIFLLFTLVSTLLFSQEKVKWIYSFNSESSTVQINAIIDEGWHLYSQYLDNEIGPVPTSITFKESRDYFIVGNTIEPESIKEYDENFEGELNFFKGEVTFIQKIKVKKYTTVKGVVTFMVCNDSMCLPPKDIEFTIKINK
ncbi:MAG: protein-disulfide reductase DsbD family protein [Crocinitomicaceae bacterium]